ncbi:MAG TPA: aminotransferase class I/II-fold pyridoxal phosphate-dependent enzyme, partial [Candidatus Alistipes excrementipullorum]|nr:aminotransferase class I/II-fold pyridoxal phosphate-dependent enzyme [Candidatus Alistipes excrementipullorum]
IMDELGCVYDPSQVGLFLWGRVPASAVDAAHMADKLLYEADVFVTPGFVFGSNGNDYIRISLCATRERMEEALERIIKMKKDI